MTEVPSGDFESTKKMFDAAKVDYVVNHSVFLIYIILIKDIRSFVMETWMSFDITTGKLVKVEHLPNKALANLIFSASHENRGIVPNATSF